MDCGATMLIDFDSIWCHLTDGHDGMHLNHVEGGSFYWIEST